MACFALSVLIDLAAGVSLVWIIRNAEAASITADNSQPHHDGAQFIIKLLSTMVTKLRLIFATLMAAPAGLKLNIPLSRFLGSFMLYLLDMWAGWVQVCVPFLPDLLWYLM